MSLALGAGHNAQNSKQEVTAAGAAGSVAKISVDLEDQCEFPSL